jgi:hypothetical protein
MGIGEESLAVEQALEFSAQTGVPTVVPDGMGGCQKGSSLYDSGDS